MSKEIVHWGSLPLPSHRMSILILFYFFLRQVKLPKRPKVPPPFPVRLRDGGPIELLGSSGGRPLPPYPSLQFPPFPPFPPAKPSLPPPPFPLPPGAVFLPPPSNQTEPLDEDDPSIYYPPPYDFSYPKDNSSKVPAGPLVPGIVLPPPPDFFGPQEVSEIKKLN